MHLQAPVTDEKDGPPQLEIPSSTGGTKGGTDGEPNTIPQGLVNEDGIPGEGYINHAKARSSSLSDDNVLRLEELPNTRPQVCLSDVVVGFVGDWVGEWWNGDLLRNNPEFSQLGRQFGKEVLEADSTVERVRDLGTVRMKLVRKGRSVARRLGVKIVLHLNGLAPWNVTRPECGVEVVGHRSDGDEQFRTLDLLKDIRVSDGSKVNLKVTTESPAVANPQ